MLKNFISATLLVVTLLGVSFQTAFAKSKGDWSQVISSANNEIAVKPVNGEIVFGKLTSANDTEITVQIASKKELTNQTKTFQKSEIKKVWQAELRLGKGLGRAASTGVGAAVGGGVGAGIGVALLGATGGSDYTSLVLFTTTIIGAGAGSVVGLLAGKGGHKKKKLLYEI